MSAGQRTPPKLLTLILLTGLSVLSLNMFLPSLTQIAATYDADYGIVSLSIGGYLGLSAVLQLIMGPLSDRIGRRRTLIAAAVAGALGAGLIALGSGFAAFLLACVFVALCFDMRLRSPDGDCPNSFS